ncbi:serine--tRNA ligase [Pseudobacteriovorax antillogorgiicola]|uniref:Serine--tRNA ligase n=1 Tax=Pseudobacteriovorax antillogorgiicola TaxID=1513793 RepID=A0A1Y6CE74_9BACT|nr:serine--tRNA ligase [Pseudobacteriovorax antillogorgiicola]TCS51807.1 seryl-tRNA synthetase [Pseudobacteriovorax antillogorgiicola]SMF50145.1 seryl-tRNA synthetase [Pseudobacteriovorax antillogorgiicola]
MLDIKFIRENKGLVEKAAKDKHFKVDLDSILSLDDELKSLQSQLEELQSRRNAVSKKIPKVPPEEQESLKAEVAELKPRMDELGGQVKVLQDQFNEKMLAVPAPARADVPVGKDDAENVQVKTWGTLPSFDFKIRDHVELGQLNDWIDIPRGVKLAGSRSYVLKGDAARLESALLKFTLDHLYNKGYQQLSVPVLVKEDCMVGTGYFPNGRDQAYYIERDELALVGTAEVPVASYHSDEMLKEQDLPIRYMAQSSCFRREAGTYGKDTHGLYRVHQFQKVEQVIIAKADEADSEALHNELLNNSEQIMQALELPYQVVYVCTGDLGQGQVRKHDIETWMPSRNAYSETHSCSTFHDFQARRLKIRYKDSNKKKNFCYTLNNTAIATPRVLIPFIEVHQQADGSIFIPEALRPYLNGQEFIGKK